MLFSRPARRGDATRTYYVLNGVATCCLSLSFTVNLVYMATEVGLDPLQLVLVGTALEITCFVFEVPTGIVADLYSRRASVLIGFALIGLGLLLQAVPLLAAILAAQVVWGIGYTFTSGATQAWITDEVGEDRVACWETGSAWRGSARADRAWCWRYWVRSTCFVCSGSPWVRRWGWSWRRSGYAARHTRWPLPSRRPG
jgi:MFS family permease